MNRTAADKTFALPGSSIVINRIGYGAMQLAGPGAWGPPESEKQALDVLRTAVELGVNHIDTSDYYGPHITNRIIRKALHPYPDNLAIVTKIGCFRDDQGGWISAASKESLIRAVYGNLENLGVETLDVVNFRSMLGREEPGEGSIEEPLTILAELKEKGIIRNIGISHVTPAQVQEAMAITDIACVQNHYNLANRKDDNLIDLLAAKGIAYVPYFPLGGFSPLQSRSLTEIADKLARSPMQVALAWLLQRSENILLIPGTSSVDHLKENLNAAELNLSKEDLKKLDDVAKRS